MCLQSKVWMYSFILLQINIISIMMRITWKCVNINTICFQYINLWFGQYLAYILNTIHYLVMLNIAL
jgi:hypothetical protein